MKTRAKSLIILTLLALLLTFAGTASAQSGQFCARAYEDRNGNGLRDAGEPFLTRGIGATLQDSRGVVVATAILDNSPTAGQGVICFQNLAFEQYTLTITSADFQATTTDTLVAVLSPDDRPPVLEYGGQRVNLPAAAPVADAPTVDQDELVERALVAAAGSAAAMLFTALFGLLLYLLLLRPRPRRRPVPAGMMSPPDDARYRRPDPRQTTGTMQPVDPRETGETRP